MTNRSEKAQATGAAMPGGEVRMPAEWEPHAATWLAWPHYRGDWPGKFEPIPWVYAEIIRHLARHERVELIVNNAVAEKQAKKVLHRAGALSDNVRFHRWPTDRVWTRDSGCTFVVSDIVGSPQQELPGSARPDSREQLSLRGSSAGSGSRGRLSPRGSSPRMTSRAESARMLSVSSRAESRARPEQEERVAGDLEFPSGSSLTAIKWRFNAWAKYPNWKKDEKIGSRMAKTAGAAEVRPLFGQLRIVLEGGSIDVNGCGTLLTTEECLLSKEQERNPGMGREDYEKVFADYLGIKTVVWLGKGIVGDDTHGHVDDISRFVAPDTIVTMVEPHRGDPNHAPLQENLQRLKSATDDQGRPFQVIDLPMPGPICFEGRRLPASYGNFYIANEIVLVPVFNDPNDRIALNILSDLFPDREVIGIYSGDLIWGFGAMHCMTQQQPAG